MYQVRHANWEDFERILEIYAIAREFMANTGNPTQWGSNYPPVEMLKADIPAGNLYVVDEFCRSNLTLSEAARQVAMPS